MCLNPFIVVFERCGCTAYRVMTRCSDAGDDLFGICAQSLYEATQDEEIFEEIWDAFCPLHGTLYVENPANSFETPPASDGTEQVDPKT